MHERPASKAADEYFSGNGHWEKLLERNILILNKNFNR